LPPEGGDRLDAPAAGASRLDGVLIATPNLGLDRIQFVGELVPGSVIRASSVEVAAGGKGVNVARVMRAYGRRPALVGFVPADDGQVLLGLLAAEGADVEAVPVPGRTRQIALIIEDGTGRTTSISEPGALRASAAWPAYLSAVDQRMGRASVLVCSGSQPQGAPVDGYAQLVRRARLAGRFTVVDAEPAALLAALPAGPDLVTPNLEEAEATIVADASGGPVGAVLSAPTTDPRGRSERAAAALQRLGAARVAITAGAHGVCFADVDGSTTWTPSVPVEVLSTVGAGDAFLAGLLLGLPAGFPAQLPDPGQWRTAVARGVATASAACERLRPGDVDPARVEQLLAQVTG
jgi:1-phosphofructokinase family hexose kinase